MRGSARSERGKLVGSPADSSNISRDPIERAMEGREKTAGEIEIWFKSALVEKADRGKGRWNFAERMASGSRKSQQLALAKYARSI